MATRKRRELTRGMVRIAEAAKILGVHRVNAWRALKPYAVERRTQRGKKFFLVPVGRVYRELANKTLDEVPVFPEIQDFRDELDVMQEQMERANRILGKLARKAGMQI